MLNLCPLIKTGLAGTAVPQVEVAPMLERSFLLKLFHFSSSPTLLGVRGDLSCEGGVGPSWSCIPVFGVSSGFIPRELELPEMPKGPEEALIALSKSRANLGAFLSSSGFKERCPHQGGDGRHEREQQTFD